jgi:hypothetical protein
MEQAYLQIWRGADGSIKTAARRSPGWWRSRRLAIDNARRAPPPTAAESSMNDGPGTVPPHQLTDDLKRLLTTIGRLGRTASAYVARYYGAGRDSSRQTTCPSVC